MQLVRFIFLCFKATNNFSRIKTDMKKIILFVFISFFIFIPQIRSSSAEEKIISYKNKIQIDKSGKITVKEKISYDFGSIKKHGTTVSIPYIKENEDGKKYAMQVDVLSVKDENGKNYKFTVKKDKDKVNLRIGDPNLEITGIHEYIIKYEVKGALTYFLEHDELYWNTISADSNIAVLESRTDIVLPYKIENSDLRSACFVSFDKESNTDRCQITSNFTENSTTMTFSTKNLSQGEGVTVVFGFPKNIVEILEPELQTNFFDTLFGTITLFMLFGVMLLWYIVYPIWIIIEWYLKGRDPKHSGTKTLSAYFDKPKYNNGEEFTACESGALIDEKFQIREFVGMIVELAQKGYLKIKEEGKKDFSLEKLEKTASKKDLKDFELNFLTEVFNGKTHVRLKDEKSKFRRVYSHTEKKVYDLLVQKKLFPKNPKKVREFYSIVTGVSVFTFNFPLSIVSSIFGNIMPRKTLDGVHVANEAKSLRNFLQSQERQLEFQADNQLMFEKFLPYAVCFGVEKKWTARFKDLDIKEPDWYTGKYSKGFEVSAFSKSLNSSFSNSVSEYSTYSSSTGHSSGFSGGSVGGGGGGSSVGSW